MFYLDRSWGSGARTVDAGMFGRYEESFRKYKRPDGYDFMKEARTVGVPISLDSNTYRYAFAESKTATENPAKRTKTLSGQPMEAFEFRLARSVRKLGKCIISGLFSWNVFSVVLDLQIFS